MIALKLLPRQQSAGAVDVAPDGGDPASQGADDLEKSTRILLFLLLLLVVIVILAAAIMFSDDSRVFLLKFAAAALLSFLPGWIYLQFIRNKGHSLYNEYVLNLFRLKIDKTANLPAPPEHTTWYPEWKKFHGEVVPDNVTDNLYRRKFESVYGPASVSTRSLITKDPLKLRERTEAFGPVVMATIVMALSWTLLVQPELFRNIELIGGGLPLSGKPILPADPLRFGFLGAYAFIVLDLLRRYFRDDLKAAAYLSATIRIVFASALIVAADAAGLAELVGDERTLNLAAFFVGFFPRAGFTWLRAMLPDRWQQAIPQLESDYPLRNLEGLSIWYESRLIEEGIESIQNLCSASLVDLMLKTRIPVTRLVDWLDQAYLFLHLPAAPNGKQPPGLLELRRLGIRTATDLERAWTSAKDSKELAARIGRAVEPNSRKDTGPVISSIMLSLEGEPNFWHVRAFRELQWLKDDPDPQGNGQIDSLDSDQTGPPLPGVKAGATTGSGPGDRK